MNWFNNNTGSRAPELLKAGKVSKAIVIQLVLGGIQKRRISKAQSHHAYLHMFRDKLLDIIRIEWALRKKEDPDLDENQQAAFRNRRLQEMLAAEPKHVQDRVEAWREADLKRRLEEGKEDDNMADEIVVPNADLLSREEVERIKIGLIRQRRVPSLLE